MIPEWVDSQLSARTVVKMDTLEATRSYARDAQRAISAVYADPHGGMSRHEWLTAFNTLENVIGRINRQIERLGE